MRPRYCVLLKEERPISGARRAAGNDWKWVDRRMVALADFSACCTSDLITHGFGMVDVQTAMSARSSHSLSRKRKVTYSLADDS